MKTNSIFTIPFMLLLICCISFNLQAQTNQKESGKARWMDFWVGSWNLTWKDKDGTDAHGYNEVKRTMNGKVIQENFKALSGAMAGFKGKSWSVFNEQRDSWFQTWVDSEGSYLDFTFELDGEKRIFKRSVNTKEGMLYQRMVFYNITRNSFDWDWQASKDGSAWNTAWKIHYERIKKAEN